uniref:(northern house mosquito) hypothetical protein n=1 Tax=Culex pipiens TaxID=7175 RepID=A0A8D8CU14_CULPI
MTQPVKETALPTRSSSSRPVIICLRDGSERASPSVWSTFSLSCLRSCSNMPSGSRGTWLLMKHSTSKTKMSRRTDARLSMLAAGVGGAGVRGGLSSSTGFSYSSSLLSAGMVDSLRSSVWRTYCRISSMCSIRSRLKLTVGDCESTVSATSSLSSSV